MNSLPDWMREAKVPGTAVAVINRGEEDQIDCFGEVEHWDRKKHTGRYNFRSGLVQQSRYLLMQLPG